MAGQAHAPARASSAAGTSLGAGFFQPSRRREAAEKATAETIPNHSLYIFQSRAGAAGTRTRSIAAIRTWGFSLIWFRNKESSRGKFLFLFARRRRRRLVMPVSAVVGVRNVPAFFIQLSGRASARAKVLFCGLKKKKTTSSRKYEKDGKLSRQRRRIVGMHHEFQKKV